MSKTCFKVPRSKVHRLVEDSDKDRFPLGRAKCAPFPRLPGDDLLNPNGATADQFCRICL